VQGGAHSRDLAFINAHLNAIGGCLVAAILALTAALWVAGTLHGWAWPARASLAAVHLLLLAYDHGGDFSAHGFYNWCAGGGRRGCPQGRCARGVRHRVGISA
jgi:hypothetical protein